MSVTYEDPTIPPLIAAPVQSFVVDPNFADTVEVNRAPVTVANPTSDPNRYTMHVPKETSVVSLGAASGTWTTDLGIVGYTDSHIHFETKEVSKTVVSLGGPATTAGIGGYSASGGNECSASAPGGTRGYSMVTEMNAWHEAQQQHYWLSQEDDITLRTTGEEKRAVLQAEAGYVDLVGKKEVNIAGGGVSIGARADLEFEDIHYAKPWTGKTLHATAGKRTAIGMSILNAALIAHNTIAAAAKMRKEHKAGELHSATDALAEVVEWAVDLAEAVRLVGEVHELLGEEEAPEQSIKIDAEADFGGAAGGEVAFFGQYGASLTGGIWTSVSAIVSAGLKGTVFAGVAAAYTSLKGYKKIELSVDHGDAHFSAKGDVTVGAEGAFVGVGKEIAQMSSAKDAYFAGKNSAWVGVAAGDGWGMSFVGDNLTLGKATSPKTMKSAGVAADRSIKFDKDGITLTSASTQMVHDKRRTVTKSTDVKFHAKDGDVKVDGKKVLVDGP